MKYVRLNATGAVMDIASKIDAAVSDCQSCRRNRREKKRKRKQYRFSPIETLEIVAIDIFEPLPKTKMGKQFKVVLRNALSKRMKATPLTKKVITVATVMTKDGMWNFGIPLKTLTDNGPQFTTNSFQAILKELW